MTVSSIMDFDRPYAKTTSIDGPPHYLQDGKMFSMNGDEIVSVIEDQKPEIEQPSSQPEELIEQPKKRGRKPKDKNDLAN